MIFLLSFTLVTVAVQGKPPLEVSATVDMQDLSSYGVDAESCRRIVYQAKGCKDHDMFLFDGEGTQLVRYIIGGWYNSRSRIDIYPTGGASEIPTSSLLHCDEFRWFWMSWDAGRIKYGKGRVPGEDAIFDLEDPTGSQVKRFGFLMGNYAPSTIRLGETERGRFVRVLQGGKFSDGMISETSTSRQTCAILCIEHVDCGMFSYNQDIRLCAIFDRMTSSFTVTSENDWTSWKLLYCFP